MSLHRITIFTLGLTLFALVASCGPTGDSLTPDTGNPAATPTPAQAQAAQALSQHYVEVVFDVPVDADGESVDSYAITGPNSSTLDVVGAQVNEDRTRVILTTGTQQEVVYSLAIGGKANTRALPAGAILFRGSSATEPYVSSAISLDSTHVLVTFNERMDDNVTVAEFYRVNSPDLAVTGAVRGAQTTVELTTAPQEHVEYTIQVSNISAGNGNKLINPTHNSAVFTGIAPVDTAGPNLAGAASISDSQVLLTFSEPLKDGAADPANFSILPSLVVTGAAFNYYNTQITLNTLPQKAGTPYTVTIATAFDRAGNPIVDHNADFTFAGQPGLVGGETLPRVVGALSTGNKSVLVAFSKVMGEGLAVAANYRISGSESGYLLVTAASAGADKTFVNLTTLTQAPDLYTVHVVNVKDASGNPLAAPDGLIAPPEGVDPSAASFRGTGPVINNDTGLDEHTDTDGDGFADWFEQLGWFVTVQFDDGTTTTSHVTSDPYSPDTDGDGILDGDENRHNFDPRTDDTDADQVSDFDEYNIYYSDPRIQDSDDDGYSDLLEIGFFGTSPILADTDGDGLEDGDEIITGNRDPLIADLPRPSIDIGDFNLTLDTRFSFTDTQGVSRTSEESVTSSVEQNETDTFETSDAGTTQHVAEVGASGGVEEGKPTFIASAGYSYTNEETVTLTEGSSESLTEAYENSLTTSESVDKSQEVTREVFGASMQAVVTLRNAGDIAFSLSGLEVSALLQDPKDREKFVPIGTLLPAQEGAVFNLGPFVPERGPFVFNTSEVFPGVVENLMKNPRGLIFRVANFDMTDELGRNFAFTSQDVNDRTAGLILDFAGRHDTQSYRVATSSTFNIDTGAPEGITMGYALRNLLSIPKRAIYAGPDGDADTTAAANTDDVQVTPVGTTDLAPDTVIIDAGPNGILDTTPASGDTRPSDTESYSTYITTSGVQFLRRINDVANDTTNNSFWAVLTSVQVPDGTNFDDIVLQAGDNFSVAFVKDQDTDGLYDRLEFLYGSSDLKPNTDLGPVIIDGGNGIAESLVVFSDDVQVVGQNIAVTPGGVIITPGADGYIGVQSPLSILIGGDDICLSGDTLGDFSEVQTGWLVEVQGRVAYRAFSDPTSPDSDADGLHDHEEAQVGTDPGKRDTDDDGITDFNEAVGVIFAGKNGIAETSPNGNRTCGAFTDYLPADVQSLPLNGFGDPTDAVLVPDRWWEGCGPLSSSVCPVGNTLPQGPAQTLSTPGGDDKKYLGLNALNPDTDGDGQIDGLELALGASPLNPADAAQFRDTDNDGLVDSVERADGGWTVEIKGRDGTVTSTYTTFSSPLKPDTDEDGLPDLLEQVVGADPTRRDTDADGLLDFDEFEAESESSINLVTFRDFETDCLAADRCSYDPAGSLAYGTSVTSSDTDADGRLDNEEIFESWTVRVCGAAPYDVTSSPTDGDRDRDNVEDGDEESRGLDPLDFDTDNDGLQDDTDGVPDGCGRVVTFAFVSQAIGPTSDCDGGATGAGDFSWSFTVNYPSSQTQSFSVPETGLSENETQTFSSDLQVSFTLRPGESFNFSGTVTDDDGSSSDDEVWNIGTRTFTFSQISAISGSQDFTYSPSSTFDDTQTGSSDPETCYNDDVLTVRVTVAGA